MSDMTQRQPLPRWYWPVIIGCVIWIAVLALSTPLTPAHAGAHAEHDHDEHP